MLVEAASGYGKTGHSRRTINVCGRSRTELNFGEIDELFDGVIAWSELKSKMEEALAVGDSKAFVELLGGMARQRGMSRVSQETGLAREALISSTKFGWEIPSLPTIVKVTMALGLQLCAIRKVEESTGFK